MDLRPVAFAALVTLAGCSGASSAPVYLGAPDTGTPPVGGHLPPPGATVDASSDVEGTDAAPTSPDVTTGPVDAAPVSDAGEPVEASTDDAAPPSVDAAPPPVDAWEPPPGTCTDAAPWCPTGFYPNQTSGACMYPGDQGDAATRCGGCSYLPSDSNNCGACGVVCGAGTACKAGSCTAV